MYTYIYLVYFKQKDRTPSIKKKLTHVLIVNYKYQQRSFQS